MVAALNPPTDLSPWWTDEKCETHQPYPSKSAAERAAGLHPSRVMKCPKCNEGRRPEPFRCHSDPNHWHWGHGDVEGPTAPTEDVMVSMANIPSSHHLDARSAPLRGGDTWVSVSAKGRGQPVEIVTVNPTSVYFRAIGRGSDQSQKFKLPIEAFRVRYAPLRMAEARQKQLATAERNGTPETFNGRPVGEILTLVEAVHEDEPVATTPETPPAPTVERVLPYRGGKPPALSDDQAREVYLLVKGGGDKNEVAQTYGVSWFVVHSISKGDSYKWAIGDLIEQATPPPAPEPKQEEPVQTVTPPTVLNSNAANGVLKVVAPPSTLLADAADALETLAQYAGQPLPKFVRLDLDAIRAIVEQLRTAP